jgi:adenylate kinase family enzyme
VAGTHTNPGEFIRRVSVAVSAEAWVLDGNYGVVRKLVWSRGTHLIWLDYSRSVIMYRVIKRSIVRAVNQTELWAGNRENWGRWLRPSHPITWAWTTWRRRRLQFEDLLQCAEYKNLVVLRIHQPRDATKVLDELRGSV